jgi:hypothetical protein
MARFGTRALVAPIVGVGGSHDVLMAILIGVCGVFALAVNLAFGPQVAAPLAATARE